MSSRHVPRESPPALSGDSGLAPAAWMSMGASLAGAGMLVGLVWGFFGYPPDWLRPVFSVESWGALAAIAFGIVGAVLCRRQRSRAAKGSAAGRALTAGLLLGWLVATVPAIAMVGFMVVLFVAGAPD
jgi:hypothetical protein